MGEELAFTHFPHSSLDVDTGTTSLPWDVDEATTSVAIWNMRHPTTVSRVGIEITTDIVYGTTPTTCVCSFYKRVIPNSDTGRIEIARVSLPDGAKVGQIFFVDVPPSSGDTMADGDFVTGQQLTAQPSVQGAGGTKTGDWSPVWFGNPASEAFANQLWSDGTQGLTLDTTTLQPNTNLAEVP